MYDLVTQSCPTLCDPVDCSLSCFLCQWDSSGKSTEVSCHFLLQHKIMVHLKMDDKLKYDAKVKVMVAQSCLTLCDLWTVDCQAPLSMEFSRQEYWRGQSFPSPGDLPDPGIEPKSPTLQADALTSEPPGKPPKLRTTEYPTGCQERWPVLVPTA